MGSLFQVLGLCFLTLWSRDVISQNAEGPVSDNKKVEEGTLVIDGRVAIANIDSDFICATLDWWPPEKCDYGTCAWGLASLLNMDLENPILLNAVKAFSPLKIRLGGTLQDKVIYGTDPKYPCHQFKINTSASELFGWTDGCLPMSRWDELNAFFKKSGAKIIFGLNALNGKKIVIDGVSLGPWNSSNAASFIRYTVNKGYSIYGWELGNELSGNGVGTRITAAQYASDVIELNSVVKEMYAGYVEKPLVIAPGGFYDSNWFKELIDKTPKALDVVTHHIYNLGPGRSDNLVELILDPKTHDGMKGTFGGLEGIVKRGSSTVKAWVGEAGGAYNSGRNHVTNAFVFSFWYLDQLGMSAMYDTKTYCRQSLIGGNYGLLNTTTYVPNPDYYSALLWNRLMGRNVLNTSYSGTKKLRTYAHCAKDSQGIVLLLFNLDGNTTVQTHITTESLASYKTLKHQKSPRTTFARIPRQSIRVASLRKEYHLTAQDGDLHSQTMLLNGRVLAVSPSGTIPQLEPISVNPLEPITVAPYSIVFAHIQNIDVPACN